ncbi:hypothetical protein FJY93_01990 [Candidatus Kaiserbacteria bacterium]|nr:hypothetical protein [Candidatus Kaiserbacteria bacterium]
MNQGRIKSLLDEAKLLSQDGGYINDIKRGFATLSTKTLRIITIQNELSEAAAPNHSLAVRILFQVGLTDGHEENFERLLPTLTLLCRDCDLEFPPMV